MNLAEAEIHIWTIDLDQNTYQRCRKFLSILSFNELLRIRNFKHEQAKISFAISRVALRILLSRYIATEPEKINFFYNDYGKPFVHNKTKLCFNLSHSHEKSIIALSKEKVGVDIEYINYELNVREVAQYVLTASELVEYQVGSHTARVNKFLKLWTKKEACLKAFGTGIGNIEFRTMAFIPNINLQLKGKIFSLREWEIEEVDLLLPHYIGHIAYKRNGVKKAMKIYQGSVF